MQEDNGREGRGDGQEEGINREDRTTEATPREQVETTGPATDDAAEEADQQDSRDDGPPDAA